MLFILIRGRGIKLSERRYQNLKQLSEENNEADIIIKTLIILANLKLIKTKPFKDDFCHKI